MLLHSEQEHLNSNASSRIHTFLNFQEQELSREKCLVLDYLSDDCFHEDSPHTVFGQIVYINTLRNIADCLGCWVHKSFLKKYGIFNNRPG